MDGEMVVLANKNWWFEGGLKVFKQQKHMVMLMEDIELDYANWCWEHDWLQKVYELRMFQYVYVSFLQPETQNVEKLNAWKRSGKNNLHDLAKTD